MMNPDNVVLLDNMVNDDNTRRYTPFLTMHGMMGEASPRPYSDLNVLVEESFALRWPARGASPSPLDTAA